MATPDEDGVTAQADDVASIPQGDYVQSLGKGFAVVRAFSAEHRSMTLSEVATAAGISRPSARRFLLTLQALGYVRGEGGRFRLLPKVLDLGNAYLTSFELPEIVEPHLDALNEELKEVCSVGILDGHTVVYVARSQSKRVMSTLVRVGSRIDPAATAVGRVLLAAMPVPELDDFLARHELTPHTERTITDKTELRHRLAAVSDAGYALVDQEVELGARSIAAPLRDATGRVVAGINVACDYMRVPLDELQGSFLPRLLNTANNINKDLDEYGHAISLP